jgi:hypothetical protein
MLPVPEEILYELLHRLETIEVAQSTDAKQKLLYNISASVKRYLGTVQSGNAGMAYDEKCYSSGLGVRN